jgi:hypothetical protein
VETYLVSYVKSLEQYIADLESSLHRQVPGSASDHLFGASLDAPPSSSFQQLDAEFNIGMFQDAVEATDPTIVSYLPPLYPKDTAYDHAMAELQQSENLFSITENPVHPLPHTTTGIVTSTSAPVSVPVPAHDGNAFEPSAAPTAPAVSSVSVPEGASFFQTYFELVHPRYPFLDVEECSQAYLAWRNGEIFVSHGSGWSSYLVKMVFSFRLFKHAASTADRR